MLADGTYGGLWSGYELKVCCENWVITFDTDLGVRGLNIPVEFEIRHGQLVQESITPVKKGPDDANE